MTESFNPLDPKYKPNKRIEDFPAEERERFVNLPDGGFVRSEAFEQFKIFKYRAEAENKRRPVFKKLFFLDKISALDAAQRLGQLSREVWKSQIFMDFLLLVGIRITQLVIRKKL